MKLKNLNGWQRLWVVVSVVWFVACVVLLIQDASRATLRLDRQLDTALAERRSEWVYATIQAVPPSDFKLSLPGMPEGFVLDNPTTDQIRDFYKNWSDEELARAIHDRFPEVDFGQVNADYEQAVAGLQLERQQDTTDLRLIGIGVFALWLVPSVGVYLLAWGGWRVVLWVWRGFKLKGESQ